MYEIQVIDNNPRVASMRADITTDEAAIEYATRAIQGHAIGVQFTIYKNENAYQWNHWKRTVATILSNGTYSPPTVCTVIPNREKETVTMTFTTGVRRMNFKRNRED